MLARIALLLALVPQPAQAGPNQSVKCKDNGRVERVFIPKDCAAGFENYVREGRFNLSFSVDPTGGPGGELGGGTEVVELSTDPIIEVIQTHYSRADSC